MFVDFLYLEIREAFAQTKANHQMAVMEHVIWANAAEDSDTSEDKYHGRDTFGYMNGMDACGYNIDTSQHMGKVS